MEVVLLKDVEKLGSAGSVVNVKPGYARNFLLPGGLAAPATPQRLQAAEAAKRRSQQEAQKLRTGAEALKQKLEALSLTLKLAVGEEEKAFGSVTAHEILEALKREGIELERHALQLAEPIKTLGVFEIPVRVHAEVSATLKLWVVKA